MIWIAITEECRMALRAHAGPNFVEGGRRRPDGSWEIPVSPEVAAAMQERAFPGEPYSDVILRTLANERGLN